MRHIIDVDTGQVSVRQGQVVLRANAIGSCIAVVAFDTKTKNGGMAHIMLPGRAPETEKHKTKYAFDAIEAMFDTMIESGSKITDIETCLIGAGNVLRKPDDTICDNNVESVTAILTKINVPVRACVLRGQERKSALLDTETGRVSYTQGDSTAKMLWRFIEQTPPERL